MDKQIVVLLNNEKTRTWVSHKNNKSEKSLERVHAHLYEFSEKANLTYGNRNQNEMGGVDQWDTKGTFWGDGNVLCFDLGGYTGVCICQNIDCGLVKSAFHCM